MKRSWKKLSSKVVLTNPWFKIRKDAVIQPDGEKGEYSYVVSRPAVIVVAMTEQQEIYILQQFRYPIQKTIWELPAGGTDGQQPLQAAKRELLEETGLTAKHWKKIGDIYEAKSFSDGVVVVFLATGLTQTSFNKQKEEGILQVKKIKIPELLKMVEQGKFADAVSLAALVKTLAKLKLV